MIRIDHIGDVVMSRAALALLKKSLPQAQIDLLASPESVELLRGDGAVTELIPFRSHWFSRRKTLRDIIKNTLKMRRLIRDRGYDLAVDFRGDLRNILFLFWTGIPWRLGYGITGGKFLLTHSRPYPWSAHQAETNRLLLEAIGIHGEAPQAPFSVDRSARETLSRLPGLAALGEMERLIVIHPGAGYASKRWPADRFCILIRKLLAEGGHVFVALIGTEEEKNLTAEIEPQKRMLDLRGRIPLCFLPALFEKAALYIGNDSGPAHIAAAQGTPVLCLFSGVNRAEIWRPLGPRVELIQRTPVCSPCEQPVCPLEHHKCMTDITVDEVFWKAKALAGCEAS